MVAHYHGNRWNGAEIARAMGVTAPTVGTHLDALVDSLVLRTITPWYENLKKRQVKAPKVYVADTGLLHALLGLDDESALIGHPKSGTSWEGFAMQEIVRLLGCRRGTVLLLGNAPWRGNQPAGTRRWRQDWVRVQAHECADDDAPDALGAIRLEARSAVHGLPRSLPHSHASACRSNQACARVRRVAVMDIAVFADQILNKLAPLYANRG